MGVEAGSFLANGMVGVVSSEEDDNAHALGFEASENAAENFDQGGGGEHPRPREATVFAAAAEREGREDEATGESGGAFDQALGLESVEPDGEVAAMVFGGSDREVGEGHAGEGGVEFAGAEVAEVEHRAGIYDIRIMVEIFSDRRG